MCFLCPSGDDDGQRTPRPSGMDPLGPPEAGRFFVCRRLPANEKKKVTLCPLCLSGEYVTVFTNESTKLAHQEAALVADCYFFTVILQDTGRTQTASSTLHSHARA
jgi:hypothetical protein